MTLKGFPLFVYKVVKMPILPNAKKRLRRDRRKARYNLEAKNKVKAIIKTVRDFVTSGEVEKAKKELPKAQKIIDKAAKKNIVHKKNAARKKSRLAKLVGGARAKMGVSSKEPKSKSK